MRKPKGSLTVPGIKLRFPASQRKHFYPGPSPHSRCFVIFGVVVRQWEALADLQLGYVDQADFEHTEIHFPLPPDCRDQGVYHSALVF